MTFPDRTSPSAAGPAPSAAENEAIAWFFRQRERELSADERDRFQEWLGASPEHAHEYAQLQAVWDALGALPAGAPGTNSLLAGTTHPARHAARHHRTRRRAFAAASAVLLALGWTGYEHLPLKSATAQTGPHDTTDLTLPDGTRIHANVNTRLTVRYTLARREVRLERGEALVDVGADRRPLEMWAGPARIRDVGTEFNVLLLPTLLEVGVRSGLVALAPDPSHPGTEYALRPGDIAKLPFPAATPAKPQITQGQSQTVGSWREGVLIVHAEPLARVIDKLALYRSLPIMLADERVAALEVSGTIDPRRPEEFLRALPAVLPALRLQWRPDGAILATTATR